MSVEALQIRGWMMLEAAASQAFDDPRVRMLTTFRADAWTRPAPTGDACLVRARSLQPARIEIIPGSQSLDLRPFSEMVAVDLLLEPGQTLLVDARLWIRVPHHAGVSLTLVAAPCGDTDPVPRSGELALFASRGYVFIKGGLDEERVCELRAAIDKAMADDLDAWGESSLRAIGQLGALRNLSDQSPAFVKLLERNPVYGLLEQILAPGYVLQAYDGLVLQPGEGRFPWDFHTDLTPLLGASFPRERTLAVNVLYYLDRTDSRNGATWIVPYSHLCTREAPAHSLLAELAVPAAGDAGDILVFDSRLWHCAGTNRSQSSRRLIKTLFSEPWVRPALDYGRALSPDKWDALSPGVRALLGERSTPPTSVKEYRRRIAAETAR